MRMWNVDVKIMCNRHILGEHLEMHMFIGSIIKGTSLKGYIENGLLEVHNITKRHQELEDEMKLRDIVHNSPIFISINSLPTQGKINVEQSLKDLLERCKDCKKRYNENKLSLCII